MKVDLAKERTAPSRPAPIVPEREGRGPRWPLVAAALAIVVLVIAAYVASHGETAVPKTDRVVQSFYVDPMAGPLIGGTSTQSGLYTGPEKTNKLGSIPEWMR